MSTLSTALRRQLESAVTQARTIAAGGARHALEALAVHEPDPYRHMDEGQRDLRRKLRAQAKQLGDGESQAGRGAYEIKHLVEKLAYDQWHRLLFARFLLETNLLISPEHGVSVSLDDCEELAPSLGLKDAWAVAARFAAKELPEIFRTDDPAGAVELPVEDRKPLIQLVTGLPLDVFTASDSLGWCYQFWQAERKDEVNASGNKIGADELPAVTQLFTEDYMVDFLLDNTLGAWHAGKVLAANPALAEDAASEEGLRNVVALPGCSWTYLRFIKAENGAWTPAAGVFDGWPKVAKALTCLDPCMGSGHFVVAMFERMVALRMAEEQLDEAAAVAAVICHNVFGLEIDPRCTQIAAFNLALAAWRRIGHCTLPAMNLACSGLAPNAREADWLAIAGNNEKLKNGMKRLYALFKDAPVLGSLINPRAAEGDLLEAGFHELQPLLEKALAKETTDDSGHELAVTAHGVAKAAEILASQFTLVATNVPYLGKRKQIARLADFCRIVFPRSCTDLATVFVERSLELAQAGGSSALVTLQNWLFLKTYESFRRSLLQDIQWLTVARLGPQAFQTPMWDFNVQLIVLSHPALPRQIFGAFAGVDVSSTKDAKEKSALLRASNVKRIIQNQQIRNPGARVTFENFRDVTQLSEFASAFQGIMPSDRERLVRVFAELPSASKGWVFMQGSSSSSRSFTGLTQTFNLDLFRLIYQEIGGRLQGMRAWTKRGIALSVMNQLPRAHYCGDVFDGNVHALVPNREAVLLPLVAFCLSESFVSEVRKLDQKVSVTCGTINQLPFDLAHWQQIAADNYPDGLPKPFSSDPTQWLFNGHPEGSDQPLHVAVARLLGYNWPRQTGSSFPGCPALDPDGLEKFADEDGIVCLSPTKGEASGAERLRALLADALGRFDPRALLRAAGPNGSKSDTLEEWLRDEFFEQHCALYQHRPFIWHVWDGHKSGFSALVNYHKLDHATLEKLTYAYLGDWIRRQQNAVETGDAGSDARLQAAKQLQSRLKLILEGEPPYDLFVRWKPLSEQAIGWHPDINDGVRLNIRPFLAEEIAGGKKGAGILRSKPNIKWEKDRGKEPARDKKDFPWFWNWNETTESFLGAGKEPDGNRWNDCHYSNAFKQLARKGGRSR